MKKGLIFFMSLLLSCYIGFANSILTPDSTANPIIPEKIKTEIVSKKGTKNSQRKDTQKGKSQVNSTPIEPAPVEPIKVQQPENIKTDSLKQLLSSITEQLGTQQEEIKLLKTQQVEINESLITWDIVIVLLGIGLLIFFLLDKRNRRNEILFILTGKKSESGAHRLTDFKNEITENAYEKVKRNPPTTPKSSNSEFDSTVKDLKTRIAALEDAGRKKTDEQYSKSEPQPQPNILASPSKTLYADVIINSVLNKVTEQPNEDTVYELFLKDHSNKTAEVTIYKEAYRRVIETPDFIEGCDKQRISNTPSNLQVEKGVGHMQDNGKWQIIKKVNVKFI